MPITIASNSKGFTLIETLFAILIFSAALVSLMTIAGRGINATNIAREQLSAHYLAQEGLEVARNMRDTNFLNGQLTWDDGLATCTQTAPCMVVYGNPQTTVPVLMPCTSQCRVGEQNGAYVDAAAQNLSPYTREVYAVQGPTDQDGNYDEYKLVSTVSWNSRGGIRRTVTLQTLIKKWR